MPDIPKNWIIDSLNIIKKENDAPLAGGFTGAVMNLLGRFLLYPNDTSMNNKGKIVVKNKFWELIKNRLDFIEGRPRINLYGVNFLVITLPDKSGFRPDKSGLNLRATDGHGRIIKLL